MRLAVCCLLTSGGREGRNALPQASSPNILPSDHDMHVVTSACQKECRSESACPSNSIVKEIVNECGRGTQILKSLLEIRCDKAECFNLMKQVIALKAEYVQLIKDKGDGNS